MHKGSKLKFDREPVYLGVTLVKPHLQVVANKSRKRVNLIKKLAGSTWGANFTTLRTSTFVRVYSTAETARCFGLGPQLPYQARGHRSERGPPLEHPLLGTNPCWCATCLRWHCLVPHLARQPCIPLTWGQILPARLTGTLPTPDDVPAQRLRFNCHTKYLLRVYNRTKYFIQLFLTMSSVESHALSDRSYSLF